MQLQSECCQVYIHPELSEYLVSIVQASRHHSKISRGVSPRGTLSFLRAVQGYAMVSGREYVVPEDIKTLAMPVLGHRMTMTTSAEGRKAADIAISEILNSLKLPTENWAGK